MPELWSEPVVISVPLWIIVAILAGERIVRWRNNKNNHKVTEQLLTAIGQMPQKLDHLVDRLARIEEGIVELRRDVAELVGLLSGRAKGTR